MDHGCLQKDRAELWVCFAFVCNSSLKIFTIEKLVFSPAKKLLSTSRQLRRYLVYILIKLFILVECTWHCYPGIDHKYRAVVGFVDKRKTCNELNMLHKERSR